MPFSRESREWEIVCTYTRDSTREINQQSKLVEDESNMV